VPTVSILIEIGSI